MSNSNNMKKECTECGTIFYAGSSCPNCGSSLTRSSSLDYSRAELVKAEIFPAYSSKSVCFWLVAVCQIFAILSLFFKKIILLNRYEYNFFEIFKFFSDDSLSGEIMGYFDDTRTFCNISAFVTAVALIVAVIGCIFVAGFFYGMCRGESAASLLEYDVNRGMICMISSSVIFTAYALIVNSYIKGIVRDEFGDFFGYAKDYSYISISPAVILSYIVGFGCIFILKTIAIRQVDEEDKQKKASGVKTSENKAGTPTDEIKAVRCPSCGKFVEISNFCKYCGADIKPKGPTVIKCPKCGTENIDGKFCKNCGTKLTE